MRWLLVLTCLMSWPFGVLSAEEPSREILAGLRERKEFALALEQIKSLETKENPPVWLEFERGTTLIEQSQAEKSDLKKREQLIAAEAAFERYLKQQPGGMQEVFGQSQLGMVAVYRARQYMKNAEGAAENVRADIVSAAREQYQKGIKHNEAVVRICTAFLESREGMEDNPAREEYRKSLLQGRLLVAACTEELADAYHDASPERQAELEKAEKEYADIYVKYRTRLAGLYARMYQARCLQKLAQHPQAAPLFDEILVLPDAPEPFRTLKLRALVLAVNTWMVTEEYEKLIRKVEPFLKDIRPAEEKDEDVAALRKQLAAAQSAIAGKK